MSSEKKIENMSLWAHNVHITAKQVISRHGKDKNGSKMYKNENCMCKTIVFHS